jgi:hypothetical protein
VPAAFLDAGDGDERLAPRADQHGHVQDPVLFRAEQLLAVVEEHIRLDRVVDQELGHRAGRVDLADAEAERERLLERQVVGARSGAREERHDDGAAVLDRLAELDRNLDLLGWHWISFRSSKESQAGLPFLTRRS